MTSLRYPVIVVVTALAGHGALACSCLGGTLNDARDDAREVFIGDVLSVSGPESARDVRFRVVEQFKGHEADQITVQSSAIAWECGMDFEPGHSYLVLAYTPGRSYFPSRPTTILATSSCSAYRLDWMDKSMIDELRRHSVRDPVKPSLNGKVSVTLRDLIRDPQQWVGTEVWVIGFLHMKGKATVLYAREEHWRRGAADNAIAIEVSSDMRWHKHSLTKRYVTLAGTFELVQGDDSTPRGRIRDVVFCDPWQ